MRLEVSNKDRLVNAHLTAWAWKVVLPAVGQRTGGQPLDPVVGGPLACKEAAAGPLSTN
jgi:hypothetical protein